MIVEPRQVTPVRQWCASSAMVFLVAATTSSGIRPAAAAELPRPVIIEQAPSHLVGSTETGIVVADGRAADGSAARLGCGVSGVVFRVPLEHSDIQPGAKYSARVYCRIQRKDPGYYGPEEVFRFGLLDGAGAPIGREKRWAGKQALGTMWQALDAGTFPAAGGETLFLRMPDVRRGPDWKWIQEHNQYVYVGDGDWPNPYRAILVDRVVLLPEGWRAPGWPEDDAVLWSRLAIDHFAAAALLAQVRRAVAYLDGWQTVAEDPHLLRKQGTLDDLEAGIQDLRTEWERHWWDPLLTTDDWGARCELLNGQIRTVRDDLNTQVTALRNRTVRTNPWFAEAGTDEMLLRGRPVPERRRLRFGSVCHPGSFVASGKSRFAKLLGLDFLELNYLWMHHFAIGPGKWNWDPDGWLGGPTYFEAADAYLESGFPIVVGLLGHHASLKHGMRGSSYPDWFARVHADDPDAVAGINPWLPESNEMVETACRELAKRFATRSGVFFYQVLSEAMNRVEPARSRVGRAAFRQFLEAQFGTIARLNQAWGSEFASFEAIDPPQLDECQPDLPVGTGRLHEFVRFCQDGFVSFFKRCGRALRQGDPETPVGSGFAFTCFNTRRQNCIDFFRLASEFGDVFCAHIFTGQGGRPHYYGSFNRYIGKPIWIDEFVHGTTEIQDRHEHFSPKNERLGSAMRRQNVWRAVAWGCTTLGLFNLDPGQGNADMLDCYRFGPIIRSSARSLPTIFRETRRFEHVIANTRLVPRRSALLVPTTSLRVVQPAWAVHAQMAPLVQALEGREFFFVPEEVLVSGEEDLAEFDLLLVPYAVALPAEVSERILAFVQRGGTVVAGGPIGVTGPYGRPDGRIAKAVFGDVTPHWNPERARAAGLGKLAVRRDPGYEWWFGGGGLVPDDRCRTFEPELAWFLDELPADTEVVARHDDMPVVVARQHGKGRLVWCVWPMSNLPDRNPVAQAIAKTIPHAQVETDMRLWDSDRVLREDDRGNRYLFLVNHDPHALQPFKTYGAAGREGWITLDGVYPRVVDLSVPGGAPVPVDSRAGRTRFRTRLDPGEAIVYFLGKTRPQP